MKSTMSLQQNSAVRNNAQKRIGSIDRCKGIGILLMIYGHCTTADWETKVNGASLFHSWIYSFHMPMFFLLGGCLLAYKKEVFAFPKTFQKKASRLLLPGFYFSIAMICMHLLIKMIARDDLYSYLMENLIGLFTVEFYSSMWFLTCFFCAETIFLLLMRKNKIKLQLIATSAVLFLGAVFTKSEAHIMERLSRLMMAMCFIGIGYWSYEAFLSRLMMKGTVSYSGKRDRILLALGGVLLIVLGGFGQSFNGKVSMIDASYGDSALLFLLYALFGTLGFILLSIAIGKTLPIIEFYGRNSLTVLCTHMFFIEVFWILNSQFFHLPLGVVDARLFSLGVILLEAPTIIVINRYFPWLIGLKKQRD